MNHRICILLLALFFSFSGLSQKTDSTKNNHYVAIGLFVGSNTYFGISSLLNYKHFRFELGYGVSDYGDQFCYLFGHDLFDDGYAKLFFYASFQHLTEIDPHHRFYFENGTGIGFELGENEKNPLFGLKGGYIYNNKRNTATLEIQFFLHMIIVGKRNIEK